MSPILQMREIKVRERDGIPQGHTASKKLRRGQNLTLLHSLPHRNAPLPSPAWEGPLLPHPIQSTKADMKHAVMTPGWVLYTWLLPGMQSKNILGNTTPKITMSGWNWEGRIFQEPWNWIFSQAPPQTKNKLRRSEDANMQEIPEFSSCRTSPGIRRRVNISERWTQTKQSHWQK